MPRKPHLILSHKLEYALESHFFRFQPPDNWPYGKTTDPINAWPVLYSGLICSSFTVSFSFKRPSEKYYFKIHNPKQSLWQRFHFIPRLHPLRVSPSPAFSRVLPDVAKMLIWHFDVRNIYVVITPNRLDDEISVIIPGQRSKTSLTCIDQNPDTYVSQVHGTISKRKPRRKTNVYHVTLAGKKTPHHQQSTLCHSSAHRCNNTQDGWIRVANNRTMTAHPLRYYYGTYTNVKNPELKNSILCATVLSKLGIFQKNITIYIGGADEVIPGVAVGVIFNIQRHHAVTYYDVNYDHTCRLNNGTLPKFPLSGSLYPAFAALCPPSSGDLFLGIAQAPLPDDIQAVTVPRELCYELSNTMDIPRAVSVIEGSDPCIVTLDRHINSKYPFTLTVQNGDLVQATCAWNKTSATSPNLGLLQVVRKLGGTSYINTPSC